jgi:hypothetical protein
MQRTKNLRFAAQTKSRRRPEEGNIRLRVSGKITGRDLIRPRAELCRRIPARTALQIPPFGRSGPEDRDIRLAVTVEIKCFGTSRQQV